MLSYYYMHIKYFSFELCYKLLDIFGVECTLTWCRMYMSEIRDFVHPATPRIEVKNFANVFLTIIEGLVYRYKIK